MTINEFICGLENKNDFSFIVQEYHKYGIYFSEYSEIPIEYLNVKVGQFYIDGQEITFYL